MKKQVSSLTGETLGRIFENYSKILPLKTVFENDFVLAFFHSKPSYPKHIIITPKKQIKDLTELTNNEIYITEIFKAVPVILEKEKMTDYHLVVNGGEYQNIKQVHFHLYSEN